MSQKRLTRDEARENTCQRLIEAASRVIPRKGYQSTSVEDIAEAAGFSRGAFYSNFKSKDELFLTLLQQMSDIKHETVHAIFDEGGPPSVLLDKMRVFYGTHCRQSDFFLIWSEAKLHAARDGEFRVQLNELERNTRDQIAGYVQKFYTDIGTKPPAPPEQLALGLTALADGMALAQMLDPDTINQDNAEAVLMLFFKSVLTVESD